MSWKRIVVGGLVAGGLLSAGAAAQVPIRREPGPITGRTRQEPCWEVAGISKSAMQQRRLVTRQAREQVEAVCTNASLSLAQKREEIRQIHERERQELEALISPAQQEALKACERERGQGGIPHAGHGHGGGPCGELSTAPHQHPFAEDEENEKPPSDEHKPN